ncbi:hypothetical protein [Herminiimonas fonticola]|uniref:Lipoprotein n=1 Tax=Herminiimonas fonticola TaxID=303380 RepID=A0A4R6G8B9_9BURK|nr:hypothetical protein [Herminiimonas fonticola]RBA24259.1 hypothetical protein Hfont_2071 [Herminiimonas fonticola]TDN90260.1 hypothetical protein EV677_2336 [Herminiimonas fonticola]
MMRTLLISLLALGMFGCSETSQSQADARVSGDVPPYKGAVNDPYVIKGWTAGNKTEWDTQMRNRAQAQNEYVKVN